MNIDPEQHMLILRTVGDWARQAREAIAEIEAANGGKPVPALDDAERIAPRAFARLIEALVPLAPFTGQMPSDDLIRRAGLVPVDQAIRE